VPVVPLAFFPGRTHEGEMTPVELNQFGGLGERKSLRNIDRQFPIQQNAFPNHSKALPFDLGHGVSISVLSFRIAKRSGGLHST
jgi:hypothetical protein